MTRTPSIEQATIDEGMANLSRAHVILVGVSAYEDLDDLSGPSADMEMMSSIFFEDPAFSLYQTSQITELINPDSHTFRKAIVDYAYDRSSRGDILILYFTGHRCVIPGSTFGFCLADTRLNYNSSGVLPLSVVDIKPVIKTLSAVDVLPVFIIDACFSSSAAPNGDTGAAHSIETSLKESYSDTFGFLASSNSQAFSLDSPSGGLFTSAIYNLVQRGLTGSTNKRSPYIPLDELSAPLNHELTVLGAPLPRCFVGASLPTLPIAKNISFQPQSERFTPYMKKIIELLWKNGTPKIVSIAVFGAEISPGAYANHSKLSYTPWQLVEDGGSNKLRRLTSRGEEFAAGILQIPKEIIKDHRTGDWIPASLIGEVGINDI